MEFPTEDLPENNAGQLALFSIPPTWKKEWNGMPEFAQKDLEPFQSIKIHFRTSKDCMAFAEIIGQPITENTRSLWYPKAEIGRYANKLFQTEQQINPKYPVYIISKGRYESRLTSKALESIGVPYYIVIEPQEYDQYAAVIDPSKILVLPFSNYGQGSIPARNWVWEHSIENGHNRHWILDDNISGFYRLHNNLKTPVGSGAIFCAAEDFTDRYENIAQSGFNYFMFARRKSGAIKPYTLNTRIYPCILLRNDLPHRWRGKYNEDTDLSIRLLKDGFCTVLFNAFLADKCSTMTMRGGNTDELYKDNGRLKMAQSLKDQHPDIVEITQKWGRWQHYVNYSVFKRNKLQAIDNAKNNSRPNNYGMELFIKED